MTPGARLAAAAEVIGEVLSRKAPADRVLLQWGKSHRFAGSKDRAAIAERVYAVLRRLGECEAVMTSRDPRSLVVGSCAALDGLTTDHINALCSDGTHALGALSEAEQHCLMARTPLDARSRLNVPEWLLPYLREAFPERLEVELAALNLRAPLDLRVNSLKDTRQNVVAELVGLGLSPTLCKRAPHGIRFAPGADVKLNALACYVEGRVEVQDESSQIAVELAAPLGSEKVVDLAAGGGGKSIAMAAAMGNKGRIFACDVSPERMKGLLPRRLRAGAENILIAGNPYGPELEQRLDGGADLVFVDAPCSGSGTWRRNPEAKWNLTLELLEQYQRAQVELLGRAAQVVGESGRIIYAVCSVLTCEGDAQVRNFCSTYAGWKVTQSVKLSPASTDTDGFFAAELRKA